MTLLVRDERSGDPPRGNWARDTLAIPSPAGLPRLSDLALASDSGGAWTRDGRVFLAPEPLHVTGPAGTLHAYFEAYGVRAGTPYEVEVRVVEEGRAARAFGLPEAEVAFGLRFRSSMPAGGGPGRHHLRLDLARLPPGDYRLAVRATDPEARVSSLPVSSPLVR